MGKRGLAGRLRRKRRRLVKTNTMLRFLHEVLGLEHLHYGLWEDEPRDITGLARAQQRYADELISWIPKGVHSILDVGAGVGTTSRALAEKGFEVEGLSPDPYQREVFTQRTGLPFHLTRFQEFRPERPYDLILMSESAQYIWLPRYFPCVTRVAPSGHLLLADYFVVADGDEHNGPAAKSGHPLEEFDRRAVEAEFELLREKDVTEATVPTLELAADWVERYVEPSLDILGDSLGGRYPRAGRLARKKAETELEKSRGIVDPDLFRSLKRYLIRLYRVP